MRPKTIDVFDKNNTSKQTPAPTTYNNIDFQAKTGRFFYAKFPDTKLCSMNMKSERFENIK